MDCGPICLLKLSSGRELTINVRRTYLISKPQGPCAGTRLSGVLNCEAICFPCAKKRRIKPRRSSMSEGNVFKAATWNKVWESSTRSPTTDC